MKMLKFSTVLEKSPPISSLNFKFYTKKLCFSCISCPYVPQIPAIITTGRPPHAMALQISIADFRYFRPQTIRSN